MIQFKMLGINFVFSGVFLSDLTMIEEGNPDLIQDLINFKKRDMIYQVIEKVLRYQQVRASV
jgi:son of sevenless-like protein